MIPSNESYDLVVIGAGIFGCYAAHKAAGKGKRVLLIDRAQTAFTAASYVNQARIHSGYHYPRSITTARKTAEYVSRFVAEYDFAVDNKLTQVYAIAKQFSYTGVREYEAFCKEAKLRCEPIPVERYFNPTFVAAAYVTDEYGIDTLRLRDYFMNVLEPENLVDIWFDSSISDVKESNGTYELRLNRKGVPTTVITSAVLNVSYAGLNEVINTFGYELLPLKYEYAEMALVQLPTQYSHLGVTVMDGPFFSLMPFGFGGLHSLSAVSYTPHVMSELPIDTSSTERRSHFTEMSQLARKYLTDSFVLTYDHSIYTIKTILKTTELDDARPTFIMKHHQNPDFTSVLSGKMNTIFDLNDIV